MPATRRQRLDDAEALAREIVEDIEYKKNLKIRAIAGVLPPAVENMLWAYAYTKPPDRMEISTDRPNLKDLTPEQLTDRYKRVIKFALSEDEAREAARDVVNVLRVDQQQEQERAAAPPKVHFADFGGKSAS